jgi:hypothetical protein
VAVERLGPDHEGGAAAARVRQQVLHGGAGGDHVRERRLHADPPQLAHVVLERVARVVRHERDALVVLAQGRDRVDRAGDRFGAEPDAAVEVEDDLVVARD